MAHRSLSPEDSLGLAGCLWWPLGAGKAITPHSPMAGASPGLPAAGTAVQGRPPSGRGAVARPHQVAGHVLEGCAGLPGLPHQLWRPAAAVLLFLLSLPRHGCLPFTWMLALLGLQGAEQVGSSLGNLGGGGLWLFYLEAPSPTLLSRVWPQLRSLQSVRKELQRGPWAGTVILHQEMSLELEAWLGAPGNARNVRALPPLGAQKAMVGSGADGNLDTGQGSRPRYKLKIVSTKTCYGCREPLAAILFPLHCGVPDDLRAAGLSTCFLHEMPQQSFDCAGIKGQFTAIASMSF
ncbi:hypothetical protein MC885_009825 [Smutsia gigantea]|nr:hypothetical protein MC885_009825 [Smutsia gigantea]